MTDNRGDVLRPIAWRWRWVHPNQDSHWILRSSPIDALEMNVLHAAREVEPLYGPEAAELIETLVEALKTAPCECDYDHSCHRCRTLAKAGAEK